MGACTKIHILFAVLLPFLLSFWYQLNYPNGKLAPPADYGNGGMFDLIAQRYDLINRVLAIGMDIGWRQEMVQQIKNSVKGVDRPRILDIATGTADVALLLSSAMPSAQILGVDPSQQMLNVGMEKIKERGQSSSIRLLKIMDSQKYTDFAEADSFDAATISFGIRNVPDRRAALCEIHNVLKPGAMFCVLEFSEPDETSGTLGALARLFIRHVVPVVGGLLSGKPTEYLHLQNSIKNFPSPQQFKNLLESPGCEGQGHFKVSLIKQLNFGSVQLYVANNVKT